MTPLRRRMIEDLKLRNLAPRTIAVYVQRVAAFARHFGKSPEDLGPPEVRSYLVHLVQEEHVAWSYYNQTVAALRFLYRVTLGRDEALHRIACPKQPKKLPVVLSPEEVVRFFQAVPGLKHRALLMTAYAAGLRISEVVALRVEDVDSRRMVLRVRQGKGRKDRYVMLSPRLLEVLRAYWKAARPAHWLFPGSSRGPAPDGRDGAPRLRPGLPRRGPGQARHRPHPAAQLRHPSAGGRDRHPDDPAAVGAPRAPDHRGLHPRLAGGLGDDPEPPRSARPSPRRGSAMTRPRLEVADVFRAHGDAFLDRYGDTLSPEQRRALRDITACRTAALGGHVEQCDRCGHQRVAYNSCRNRHCPKCQATAAAEWMEDRESELLPVEYFYVVFTLPAALGPIALQNRREVYGLLFRAAAETLQQIAADPKHLGAKIGFLAVLHTWGQNLQHHPHVHCVVPGGGLSPDGSRWVACRPGFFLPVRVLSRVFRGKFLALLRGAFARGKLSFHRSITALADPGEFQRRLAASARTEWVVYAKPPFGGPEQVLKYLARYTHRVAISNSRLVALEDGEVTFYWKDYAHGRGQKTMTLKASEFIRRFLLHVLPSGFVRIRHYGFLANRVCQEKLALCRALLGVETTPDPVAADPSVAPKGDVEGQPLAKVCPCCGKGLMVIIETFPAMPADRSRCGSMLERAECDTS